MWYLSLYDEKIQESKGRFRDSVVAMSIDKMDSLGAYIGRGK